MRFHFLKIVVLSILLIPMSLSASELSLLSNNIKEGKNNNDFPKGTSLVPTQMTVKWIKDGDYATDEETLKTSIRSDTKKQILFDGNTGSNWKSRTYSKWGRGFWATLVVDLGDEYALSAFDVWALHEASRDSDVFHVLLSDDGETFTPHGVASSKDFPLEKKFFAKMHLALESPVKARYVKIRVHRRKTAKQQQIAEIAIWGNHAEEGVSYLESDSRPKVAFDVQTIQAGIVKIDWTQSSKLDANIKQWKIYKSAKPFESVNDTGVELVKRVSGKTTHTIIYPLKPGGKYYFGMTAVYAQGEYPKVNPIVVSMPLPLECKTFGDMVAINHFWGGGSHRVTHGDNHESYEKVALDLLGKSGIQHIRWWVVNSEIYQRYYEKGIGVYAYPHRNNLNAATKLGVYAFAGPKNEPDLSTMPIAKYVKRLGEFYQKKQKINPDAVMCAPSSGLEDSSIEWLEKFYKQGGKDFFDVLDLHTYCKIAGGHKVPQGYLAGAPEAMFDNMRKVSSVLSKYDDNDKPMISTEFGYTDAFVNNPSGPITPLMQAEYIVRGLVIHHALKFKRVFLYSFWDSGEDRNFTEHRFGLIDFDLQKKMAYYAVKTALDLIGDCQLKGPVQNMSLPSLGYVYQKQEGEKSFVHVIWDGSHPQNGVFQTKTKTVKQIDMLGHETDLMPDENGRFTARYGGSPIYLQADQMITFVSSEKAKALTSQTQLQIKLNQKQLIVASDVGDAQLSVALDNPRAMDVTLNLVVMDEHKNKVSQKKYVLASNTKTNVIVPIPLKKTLPTLSKLVLNVVEQRVSGFGSKVTSYPFYMRKLHLESEKPMTIQTNFGSLKKPVVILANQKLEVTIDAWRGGRVLEIIDRKSGTNQINIDYDILPNILNIPFAYGIWDSFNGKLKNTPLKIVNAKDGCLELSVAVGDLQVTQLWELNDEALVLINKVHNRSKSEKKLKYKLHPEYTVGGTGDSVVDVLYFPLKSGVEKLPFWTGLGSKKCGELVGNWWAAVDTKSKIALKQQFMGEGFATPKIWFGQGHYNVELATQRQFSIQPNQTWQTQLKWSVFHFNSKNIQDVLASK